MEFPRCFIRFALGRALHSAQNHKSFPLRPRLAARGHVLRLLVFMRKIP